MRCDSSTRVQRKGGRRSVRRLYMLMMVRGDRTGCVSRFCLFSHPKRCVDGQTLYYRFSGGFRTLVCRLGDWARAHKTFYDSRAATAHTYDLFPAVGRSHTSRALVHQQQSNASLRPRIIFIGAKGSCFIEATSRDSANAVDYEYNVNMFVVGVGNIYKVWLYGCLLYI